MTNSEKIIGEMARRIAMLEFQSWNTVPDKALANSIAAVRDELKPLEGLIQALQPFAVCQISGSLDPRKCAEMQKTVQWQNQASLKNYFCDGCKLTNALEKLLNQEEATHGRE